MWKSEVAKEKSERAKKNRRREDPNAPAESTHTGGSRSFLETSKKLGLDMAETFAWAHTKEHDKINYVSKRSTEIADEMRACEEELTQQGTTNYKKDDLLLDLVPPDKKNRRFGLGELANTIPRDRTSYGSDARTSDPSGVDKRFEEMDSQIQEICGQVQDMGSQVQGMDGRMSSVETYVEKLFGQTQSILEELKRLKN